MCQNTDLEQFVTNCEQVKEAGLIKQSFIDEMKTLLPQERFQREFMAEFIEDIDAWLTQSLIVSCIDNQLQLHDFQDQPKGEFYVGIDLGKEQDSSVVLVVKKAGRSSVWLTFAAFR